MSHNKSDDIKDVYQKMVSDVLTATVSEMVSTTLAATVSETVSTMLLDALSVMYFYGINDGISRNQTESDGISYNKQNQTNNSCLKNNLSRRLRYCI